MLPKTVRGLKVEVLSFGGRGGGGGDGDEKVAIKISVSHYPLLFYIFEVGSMEVLGLSALCESFSG